MSKATRSKGYLGARVEVDNNSTLAGVIVGTAVHEVAVGSSELCRSCWIVRLDKGDWIQGKASFVQVLVVHDDNIGLEVPAQETDCMRCDQTFTGTGDFCPACQRNPNRTGMQESA